MDDNLGGAAILFAGGGSVDIRGLHASGNAIGLDINGLSALHLKLRDSYLADNVQSAILSEDATLDLGDAVGPDFGNNVFEAPHPTAMNNVHAALCLDTGTQGSAVGNLFGNVDCRVGGTLKRSAACSAGVDIGGSASALTDVSNCH